MIPGFTLGPEDGPKGPPRKYLLMAERADGTGRMVYDMSDDREALEARAIKRATPRTRFWVEDNPDTAPDLTRAAALHTAGSANLADPPHARAPESPAVSEGGGEQG